MKLFGGHVHIELSEYAADFFIAVLKLSVESLDVVPLTYFEGELYSLFMHLA